MNKKWQFYNTDEEQIKRISNKFKLNKLLSEIIANRKIGSDEDIRIFLAPTRKDFNDPFLFKDMDIAVDRIIKAIDNKENVIIYGDYDVDGITSITVLKSFLTERGL